MQLLDAVFLKPESVNLYLFSASIQNVLNLFKIVANPLHLFFKQFLFGFLENHGYRSCSYLTLDEEVIGFIQLT